MNKIVLASLVLVTTGVFNEKAEASDSWRDKIANERGYDNHEAMEKKYEQDREEHRYWQEREKERKENSDNQRERYRYPGDDD